MNDYQIGNGEKNTPHDFGRVDNFLPASDRWGHPSFIPGCDFEHFVCPTCKKRPWAEADKVLVTDGFRMIPHAENGVN